MTDRRRAEDCLRRARRVQGQARWGGTLTRALDAAARGAGLAVTRRPGGGAGAPAGGGDTSPLSGGTSASFAYDSVGRRRTKTIGGTGTNFLYDGLNPIQELSGSTPTANLLTGLGLDETFTRSDAGGASTFLVDVLGSTLELADATGALRTQYTFEPFGATTTSGASSMNAAQFTGRENDRTGLYAYRARFYSPMLQRFVSEDPIEFAGGDVDLYAYTANSPTNFTDPLGLCLPLCAVPVLIVESPAASAAAAAAAAGASYAAWKLSQATAEMIRDLTTQFAEHTKGRRPSTAEEHEKGDERRKRDQGGEKADWPQGPRRPPRNPPPNWKGPWPPKPNPPSAVIPPSTAGRKDDRK